MKPSVQIDHHLCTPQKGSECMSAQIKRRATAHATNSDGCCEEVAIGLSPCWSTLPSYRPWLPCFSLTLPGENASKRPCHRGAAAERLMTASRPWAVISSVLNSQGHILCWHLCVDLALISCRDGFLSIPFPCEEAESLLHLKNRGPHHRVMFVLQVFRALKWCPQQWARSWWYKAR